MEKQGSLRALGAVFECDLAANALAGSLRALGAVFTAVCLALCGSVRAGEGPASGGNQYYYADSFVGAEPQVLECDRGIRPIVHIYTRVHPDSERFGSESDLPSRHRELPYFDGSFGGGSTLPFVRMEAVMKLDGQNRWVRRYQNGRYYFSHFSHPAHIDIYQQIMSLLAKGGRGYFQHRYVHTVIINKTSGERVFIDGNGGYYTLGDNVTRQLPAKERRGLFAILDKASGSQRRCGQ